MRNTLIKKNLLSTFKIFNYQRKELIYFMFYRNHNNVTYKKTLKNTIGSKCFFFSFFKDASI